MWVNQGRLAHVLSPRAYHAEEPFRREVERIFMPGWHFVGTLDDLARDGDFLTRTLCDRPVIVTRSEGHISAFLNVCAHRHALLTHAPHGNAPRLRCQYHGWEYDADGGVCKIPSGGCFVPVRRGAERLVKLRAETLGRLVFVSLCADGAPLRAWFDAPTVALADALFSPAWRQVIAWEIEHPCNWKIPLENVLETYHVESLHQNPLARHPERFAVFGGVKGARARHELHERYTAFYDTMGHDSALYGSLVRRLWGGASTDYVHHHAFPNVVFGSTSIVSFAQVVHPCSASTSRSSIRLFLHRADAGRERLSRALTPALTVAAKALLGMVLREDAAVYADVQRGMASSPHAGVLGACEERVHAFQSYVRDAVSDSPSG